MISAQPSTLKTMANHTLQIPGFSIAYQTFGDPQNPPIIALHGWLDNAGSFNLLAPWLQNDYYLIAIDLPGHGLSSHLPAGCNYHFFDGVFTLSAIVDGLKLTKTHILGHSMGACLASLAAGIFPERLLSLALIEAIGPFSAPADTCAEQMTNYLHHKSFDTKAEKPYQTLKAAATARAKRGYLALEHAQVLCERGLREEQGNFYWRHDRRLLIPTPLRMTEEQILSCLRRIQAPSCLILAENGFNFDEEHMQGRIAAVENLKVQHIAGGHHVHMEKPDTVAQYLVKFFKDQD